MLRVLRFVRFTIAPSIIKVWTSRLENLRNLRFNERMGTALSRLVMKELKNFKPVGAFGKSLSSKLKVSCERKSGFHLFERRLVTAVSFVGMKERM